MEFLSHGTHKQTRKHILLTAVAALVKVTSNKEFVYLKWKKKNRESLRLARAKMNVFPFISVIKTVLVLACTSTN